ncbi:MAG: putative ABC transport system permease protein, partial [Alcanivorax sp.]
MLARDWRGGELGVLVAALVLAVAVVSGISAFTTRLQSALEQESHRFLAADRVIRSSTDMPADWLQQADNTHLQYARTLTFPSMVFAGDEAMVLASVKAVSNDYPLRGNLSYSEQPFGAALAGTQGPSPGNVWLDSRLFALLDVAIGDTIGVGD